MDQTFKTSPSLPRDFWATPTANKTTPQSRDNRCLARDCLLATWATPAARDYRHAGTTSYRDRGGASEGRGSEQPGRSPWADIEWLNCTDGKARPVKSVIQFMADGLPESMGSVCPAIIAKIEEKIDGQIGQADRGQAVLDLWLSLGAQTVRWPYGGLRNIQEAPILLSFMCQLAEQGWQVPQGVPQSRSEASRSIMRMLRHDETTPRPPHQRGLDEQRSKKSANAVCILSSILAFHAQEAWGEAIAANARDAFPLAVGVSGRVGKLRAAGNAIVPQVAAEFIRAFCEASDGN